MVKGIDFEPEIEFPENAFDAARVFLGVLAYPERGAGLEGGLGCEFTAALWNYLVWNGRKAKGLRWIRAKFDDPHFRPPAKREFEGALERGLRRLRRRSVAYSLTGTQLLNGFFRVRSDASKLIAEGRENEALVTAEGAKFRPVQPALWIKNSPSPRRILRSNVARWSERFALNKTGQSASDNQKAKDLVRRSYFQSRPVLHMAHAFDQVLSDIGPTLEGWDDWDFILVLLWNPEKWVWQAIKVANSWRLASAFHLTPDLQPDQMIVLNVAKNMQDNAP